jgi:hydrogenase-4 component F
MTAIYITGAFLLGGVTFFNQKEWITKVLLVLFALLQWLFTIYNCYHYNQTHLGYFTSDALGILLLITLSIVCIPVLIHSYIYIKRHNEKPHAGSVYFGSLILLFTSISAAYMANHIAVNWIFAELTTLSASALIYHHRNKLALEGTWKYIFVCAISVTLIFIGILFLSLAQGTQMGDLSFANLMKNSSRLNIFWLRLAFIFIFTGFTAKAGLVPMYTAGIDAKDKAPAPAGAILASLLMNMGFVGIFRTYKIIANTPLHHWANMVILISAILSIFVATVYMFKVMNIKRMLAYSGIEHMGIVMLGVVAGGIGYYAALLHIILHSFVKSALFLQFNQLYRVYQSKSIYYVGNYFKYNPAGALVLLLGFISITAMPPSGLFVSEFFIFRALFESKFIIILILALLLLTLIIYAFGKNILKILFTPPVGFDETQVPHCNPWESLSQYFLLILAVWLGLNPPPVFIKLLHDAVTFLP